MTKKLTKEQEARIYCVRNGHANYVWNCFGYVHCGRCGEQIGDTLGSIFPADKVMVIGCKENPCKVCDSIKKKLSDMDKKILERLEKGERDYKKILRGIRFK